MPRPYAKLLTSLAIFRVFCGILILFHFRLEVPSTSIFSLFLIFLGQFSDHLDGFIARKFSVPSIEGYLEDSVADKLFQFAILISVVREYKLSLFIVFVVFFREISMLSLRVLGTMKATILKRLKIYSIFYAIFLRVSLLLFVIAPYLGHAMEQDITLLIRWSTLFLYLLAVPASIGIYQSAKALNYQK